MESWFHPSPQFHGYHCLRNSVRDGRDGGFILLLLQSRLGWIWFVAIRAGRGVALMV